MDEDPDELGKRKRSQYKEYVFSSRVLCVCMCESVVWPFVRGCCACVFVSLCAVFFSQVFVCVLYALIDMGCAQAGESCEAQGRGR